MWFVFSYKSIIFFLKRSKVLHIPRNTYLQHNFHNIVKLLTKFYFPKNAFTASAIRALSSSDKLEPEGKHNPQSNNFSATLFSP